MVVDEAHAFRNPHTRRYAALALLCEHARVLLLTATPVNNSLLDFYHLTRLFAARDLFSDLGVPDLLAAVESAMRGGASAELRRVADAVMVRRTRRAVMSWRSHGAAPASLRFPASDPIETLRYDLRAAWPELLVAVQDVIPALTFPAHGLTGDASARELMRLGLLKRLESSTWALQASVRRHMRLLDHFVSAAGEALLFDVHADRAELVDCDGAVQLSLRSISLRPWPPSLDRTELIRAAAQDLRALRRLAALFPRAAVVADSVAASSIRDTDPKLARLTALLDDELAEETVLLFTEYQETARGLWRALSHRSGIALVHGTDARLGRGRSSRRAVIERFAPRANHARTPRAAERVRLLIGTDVLAEGLN
ncbi:MAG: SNF2-related protein, partial [Longimicrobiales bacterium]